MKTISHGTTVFLLLPLIMCFAAVQAPAQQGKPFKWSMSLQNVKTSEVVDFSRPVKSQTGEQFRLMVQPTVKCFFYIIAESPNGDDVSILYAGSLKKDEVWLSEVLELTNPQGSESLFVITSQDEQKVLAQRIAALNESNSATQKRALMNEIFRIRSDASKFKEAPEKPVLMGGASRGSAEKSQGVEFSGVGTYVKTISIEH